MTMEDSRNASEHPSPSDYSELSAGARITCIVLYVVLMVLIVAGNGVLLYVIVKAKELKRSSRIFLVSLTVADLFVGLVAIPLRVVPQIIGFSTGGGWVAPDRLCEAQQFLEVLAISASVLAALALTVERYLAVEMPLRFRSLLTSRRACLVVTLSWLISVSVAFSLVILSANEGQSTAFDESSSLCVPHRLEGLSLFMFLDFVLVFFLIPLCVTFLASIRILCIVRNHTDYQKRAPDPTHCNCACSQATGAAAAEAKTLPSRLCDGVCRGLCRCFLRNKKALVTVLILTLSYAASSVPFVVCMLYVKLSAYRVDRFLVELANVSLFTSCFVNVIVYTARNRAFGKSAKHLLCVLLHVRRHHDGRDPVRSQSDSKNVSTSTQNTSM